MTDEENFRRFDTSTLRLVLITWPVGRLRSTNGDPRFEQTLSKSTPYSWRNPFATILALYLGLIESMVCLRHETQRPGSARDSSEV